MPATEQALVSKSPHSTSNCRVLMHLVIPQVMAQEPVCGHRNASHASNLAIKLSTLHLQI